MLRLLYFSWVREAIGTGEEQVEPSAEVTTVGALADWLAERSPAHAAALQDRSRVRAAIDQTYAEWNAPLSGAREVAFFPPVTGG